MAGLVRLVHPFPSLLDGVATAAIAVLAGGEPLVAVRLGGAMVALQASIGALNDLIDAPADADRKPGKPIPAGLVPTGAARATVVLGAATGLALAALSGLGLTGLGGVVLLIGYGYDRWAKGTAWSWLPFALGIPLLPVFAWFGATGAVPARFAILVPAAVAAGAALAIANALADLERDQAAGQQSVAVWLGPGRAWAIEAVLLVGVIVVAIGTSWLDQPGVPMAGAVTASGAVVLTGLVLARGDATAERRERAWEIQAIGVALLATAWLASIGGAR